MEGQPSSGYSCTDTRESPMQDAALSGLQNMDLVANPFTPVSHSCDMCEIVLTDLLLLAKKHLASIQPLPTEQQKKTCNSCGRGFYLSLEGTRVNVIRSEPGQNPFSGSYSVQQPYDALAVSGNEYALATDALVKIEKEEPTESPLCNPSVGSLVAQQQTPTAKGFRCDVCGKVLQRKSTLLNHKLLHTGSRPYVCDECGKSYITRSNLNRHYKCHVTAAMPVNEGNEESSSEATPSSSAGVRRQ